jgi:hypothetical protein
MADLEVQFAPSLETVGSEEPALERVVADLAREIGTAVELAFDWGQWKQLRRRLLDVESEVALSPSLKTLAVIEWLGAESLERQLWEWGRLEGLQSTCPWLLQPCLGESDRRRLEVGRR